MAADRERRAGGGPAIECHGLTKVYPGRLGRPGGVTAVDGVSFAVPRGEVFGLLGPNGAGKTTTVGMLTTRVRITRGRALVAGVDVAREPVRARARVGVVPQRNNLDRSLTVRENLLFHAAYFGVPRPERERRAAELLEVFGLAEKANERVQRLSGGQAQRLLVARALMHEPEVLFLDEPTVGLDPQARRALWGVIAGLGRRGLTVVLTTHYMEEADHLCHRVAIMDRGRILALDTPAALKRLVPGGHRVELALGAPCPGLAERLERLPGVERAEVEGGGHRIRLYAAGAADLLAAVAREAGAAGAHLAELSLAAASLEDLFIHLTGRGLAGGEEGVLRHAAP